MALSDSISQFASQSIAPKNRVEMILDDLQAKNSEDQDVLEHALADTRIPHHVLTKALRREYGKDAVKDSSVADWRRKHLGEVTGL